MGRLGLGSTAGGTFSVKPSGDTIRVAVLADVHLAGPQYELGSESNEVDNLSVTRTQQRLWRAVKAIHAIKPRPDLALFLGDIVHNGLDYSTDFDVLTKVQCGNASASAPRELSTRLFRHFFRAAPYTAVDVGGWKIVMLNSVLGHTWDYAHPECNTRLSSYGAEQLAWLGRQLGEGKPTLVGLHFPLPTSVREGDTSLVEVLAAHSNVKGVISGHFHKGFDWGDLYPFPHITLPAVRYDEQNFFILELEPQGTFRQAFLDLEKNRGGARCSDTWDYDGQPTLADAHSKGDCGSPLRADTASYTLPAIRSPGDIPPSFNPEGSCSMTLAAAFLEECKTHGPSEGCCALLTTQFAPTSSWPFASCFCQPGFWTATEALFRQGGREAADVVDACIRQTGKVVLRRGAGACPSDPSLPS
ncbi:hypothetical protein N2152v2_011156 [Parachlorella kessleri]